MSTRAKLDGLLADYRAASASVTQEQVEWMAAQDNETYALEAQEIIQSVAMEIQQQAHDRIATVVTSCLRSVFEDTYDFHIKFERKRGRTEATLVFVRGDLELTDPMNEAGGGIIDVAAFALRLACLVLQRPVRRRLMVLDEPFSRIRGAKNRQRMRALIESLAEDFDVQFVLNIDSDAYPEFLLGTVVEVGR